MKDTVIKILALVCFALALMFVITLSQQAYYKSETERLTNNQTTLRQELKTHRLKDSSYVAEIETLTLSKNEFEKLCTKQTKELQQLNIKLKRLQSASTTELVHIYSFDTIKVFDSILVKNVIDTIRCFNYTDNYITLGGCLADNTIDNLSIRTFDTITTFVSKEYRKKFLFFKWKPYYKVTVKSNNPYSEIKAEEFVEIK